MEVEFKVGDKIEIPITKNGGSYTLSDFLQDMSTRNKYLVIKKVVVDNYEEISIIFQESIKNVYWYFKKSDLKHYKENKMQKETILTLDNAKKMYNSGIDSLVQFALNNFSKEELEKKESPKSWKELGKISGAYVDDRSNVVDSLQNCSTETYNKNIFPTESLAKASLALSQLLQLRNAWWDGWEPYNSSKVTDVKKMAIFFNHNIKDLEVVQNYYMNSTFVFQSSQIAKDFLETFKDLLWEARELI